jgi:puromycin-sensitive aminopeptidase
VALDSPIPPAAPDWIKVNVGHTGFYRVNYTAEEWTRLRGAILERQLLPSDRLGLQSDAFALTRAGLIPPSLFLSLAEAYVKEDHASVWSDLSTNLRELQGLISHEPYLPQFDAFARKLYQEVVLKAGWDARPGEGHLDRLLRSTVLGQMGAYRDLQTINEARTRFEAFLRAPTSLDPDLRDVVYSLVAQEGDQTTFETLRALERRATLHEEKVRLLRALSRFSREDLLQWALRLSLEPEVRSQDTVMLVTAVASNRKGRDLAWEFIKDGWPEFDRRYGGGGFAIMRLVSITGGFTSLDHARDVEEFFQKHPAPAANRTIKQCLERIRLNARWLEWGRQDLAQWFAARS